MAYVSVKLALYFESETKGFVNIAANFAVKQNVRICDVFLTAVLTEGGTYPQLPTQPKDFVHCSN